MGGFAAPRAVCGLAQSARRLQMHARRGGNEAGMKVWEIAVSRTYGGSCWDKRSRVMVRCEAEREGAAVRQEQPAGEGGVADDGTVGNSSESEGSGVKGVEVEELPFVPMSKGESFMTSLRLTRALPWRRFKKGSVLTVRLEGEIAELRQSRLSKDVSLPQLTEALRKAAVDPRIRGVCLKIGPLAVGWAKLMEVRRHLDHFRKSGKYSIAFMSLGGEKEYYLANGCDEIYVPESGSLVLKGFSVSGSFVRGVLEKVGVEPQVQRIGSYKSAGDQFLRKDMSPYQREQLTSILDGVYQHFLQDTAERRGKTPEEVEKMLDEGLFRVKDYKEGGWITDMKYEDEVLTDLESRTDGKPDEVAAVPLKRYASVSPWTFGPLRGNNRNTIAVIRATGAILGQKGQGEGQIYSENIIKQLRRLKKRKNVKAVVLRIDSPGGDALASDLMWQEIRQLSKEKPVVASMGDVAASGGYYMAMACNKIVCEPLTITGSIGVVSAKFNLEDLYQRAGYSKEVISRGKYAELLLESRSFRPEEQARFEEAAQYAYESFRNKAATSRGMTPDAMQAVAQGRVWTGNKALDNGLVDALGGVNRALALAQELAGLKAEERTTVQEMSKASMSPLALLSSSGASAGPGGLGLLLLQLITGPEALSFLAGGVALPWALQQVAGTAASVAQQHPQLLANLQAGISGSLQNRLVLEQDMQVDGVGSQQCRQQVALSSSPLWMQVPQLSPADVLLQMLPWADEDDVWG